MLILHFCSFHSYFLSLAFLALSPSGSGGRLGLDVEALDGVDKEEGVVAKGRNEGLRMTLVSRRKYLIFTYFPYQVTMCIFTLFFLSAK